MRQLVSLLPGGVLASTCLLVACSPTVGAEAETEAAAPLVGEWSPDPELCADSRLSFTDDGRHEALMLEGGGWQVLASGRYERDGRQLRISVEGQVQEREIVALDDARLVLRHDDEALAEATGGYEVILHRCPPSGDAPPA